MGKTDMLFFFVEKRFNWFFLQAVLNKVAVFDYFKALQVFCKFGNVALIAKNLKKSCIFIIGRFLSMIFIFTLFLNLKVFEKLIRN